MYMGLVVIFSLEGCGRGAGMNLSRGGGDPSPKETNGIHPLGLGISGSGNGGF